VAKKNTAFGKWQGFFLGMLCRSVFLILNPFFLTRGFLLFILLIFLMENDRNTTFIWRTTGNGTCTPGRVIGRKVSMTEREHDGK